MKKEYTELEKYEMVNKAESLQDVQKAIIAFSNEMGQVEGRSQFFNAERMKILAYDYWIGLAPSTVITRMYGLRQQIMYLRDLENQREKAIESLSRNRSVVG